MTRTLFCTFGLTLGIVLSISARTSAYEPATHAGLAEQAAFASGLHARLERLGRSLGLYEPLKLRDRKGDLGELKRRLSRLDPEGGYAPDDGKQGALGWLAAGAVLEGVPADRIRHHFFDPVRDRGLDEAGRLALRTRLSDIGSGIGSLRGLFTGQSFDGSGRPAPAWALAPRSENDWGYLRYLDERVLAASARTPAERDDALARALLAAGALLRLTAEMGHPAHVRNDYRVAYEADGDPYGRFVAARYGRAGVPEPSDKALPAIRVVELVRGLAEWTAHRFYSPGALPDPSTRVSGAAGYLASAEVRHQVAYRAGAAGPRFFLDEACHQDYARALLPEIGRYQTALLRLLFRGRLELAPNDAGRLVARAEELALGRGSFALYFDDAEGMRTLAFERLVSSARPGDELGLADRPASARRAIALFRGVDESGEPIVISEELPLH